MTDHARVLTRLALAVADNETQRPLTWRLCEACRQFLSADSAAITIENTGSNRITVAATDDFVAELEDAQEVLGQGPGQDAFSSGRAVVSVLDDAAKVRWPYFTERMQRPDGALTVHALPMRPGDTVIGVLTVLTYQGHTLTEDLATAQFLSDAVGAALLRDPLARAGFGQGGPWSQRAEVHQAIGMVAAQLSIGAEDALALMRAHAYAHDIGLGGVAHLLVARELDFSGGE